MAGDDVVEDPLVAAQTQAAEIDRDRRRCCSQAERGRQRPPAEPALGEGGGVDDGRARGAGAAFGADAGAARLASCSRKAAGAGW